MPTEPYLLGSHSGCCGIWVSGPDEAWVPDDYKVKASNGKVYNRMTTVEGLFTCADGVGASRPQVLLRLARRRPYRRQADGPLVPGPQGLQS